MSETNHSTQTPTLPPTPARPGAATVAGRGPGVLPAADDRRRPDEARYRYRRGSHELILSRRGVTDRLATEVERAGAEFALVVEGPWIVLWYRIGDAIPWSGTAPFNWQLAPEGERGRIVPDDGLLSPETYARLWSTLWIFLVDADSGEVRARRAVALHPEFTQALHQAIREQSRVPFQGAAGDHALAWLNHAEGDPFGRAVARTRCGAGFRPDVGPDGRQEATRLQPVES